MSIPASHIAEAHGLETDGYPKLFQIDLIGGGHLYFRDGPAITWWGILWESNGVMLSDVRKSASDDLNRPRLVIRNPDGVYCTLVDQGLLNRAIVTRFTVRRTDLEAGTVAYQKHQWRVARILENNRVNVTAELRSALDGQMSVVPADVYVPPEYPMVSLG